MREFEVKVKSLEKALEVLNCFVEKQPLGVTEISEKLGLYKSNVHNILITFAAMDYLGQDEETGKFSLGPAIYGLTRAVGDSYNIAKIILPYMQKISQEVHELVYLAVPCKDEVVYLEAVYPERNFFASPSVQGEHCKMYCTGVGKAMLSRMPEEDMEECIKGELEKYTDYTITDKEKLREEIRISRERGYAFDNMEISYGIKCVAVPIVNKNGTVMAALSISTPSLRMDDENTMKFVNVLKKNAEQIGKRL